MLVMLTRMYVCVLVAATAGSAAVDEEMVLRVDPVNAVEVDKISDSRVAGSCGSQPEEGCDKQLPKVVGNNPKHEDSPPPMPHAASSCPQWEICGSESSGPDQRKCIHQCVAMAVSKGRSSKRHSSTPSTRTAVPKSQVWVLRKCRQRRILWILQQATRPSPKRKKKRLWHRLQQPKASPIGTTWTSLPRPYSCELSRR